MYSNVDISVDVGLQEGSLDIDGAIGQVVSGCMSDDHAKSALAHYASMCLPVVDAQYAFTASTYQSSFEAVDESLVMSFNS